MNVVINEEKIKEYIKTLGIKYDTYGKTRSFKSTTGKNINVLGGNYGWRIDRTKEKEALIKENPDYGEVICRCQTITKAEILEAINNPLGVETLTGIKYRCRAMMGRCQGGYCETRIAGLLEEVKHKNREDVLYCREGSNMFVGKVRD